MNTLSKRKSAARMAAGMSLALGIWAPEALACGGLFCSAANPVNQTAERIVFADRGDGTITQIVEILYEGPSERFAWVLPVPGVPDVGVSSKQFLDRLQQQTNPTYQLNDSFPNSCDVFASPTLAESAGGDGARNDADGGVVVLAEGTVGPFDYEVINVRVDDEDAAQVAIEWLEDNEYDVGALGPDVLRPYLQNGLNLIAFRLTKGNDSGSIRPISLSYEARNAAIPIRPTAVAAAEDMGILVWVLGQHRAVPTNYKGLELNELLINWLNPGPTYDWVVTEAANEAGGQGFVTEFAGDPSSFASVVWDPSETVEGTVGDLRSTRDVLESLTFRFGNFDGYRDALTKYVTLREGQSQDDFLTCPSCYFYPENDGGEPIAEDDPVFSTDLVAFQAEVDQKVVLPLKEAAALISDSPYMTRLYTTMSADEMTEDPVFDFNPDLEAVSNTHTAERQLTCDGSSGKWKVTFDDGRELYGEGFDWPFGPESDRDFPFNERIVAFSTQGLPKVVTDNVTEIDTKLSGSEPGQDNGGSFDSGCSVAQKGPKPGHLGAILLSFAGLSLLAMRRLRRLSR